MLKIHAVNAFQDNYIWLIQAEQSRQVLIVDPGDAMPVLEALETRDLIPSAILITHHHADHVGGIAELLSRYNVPVYGPARERIPHITHAVGEQDVIEISQAFPAIKVFDTPGHTAGHICYLMENKLFCGDTIFAGGCGRLLGGTAADLFASLERLKQLPADTEIYCAHEYTQANLRFANAVDADNEALQQRIRKVDALRAENRASVPSTLADELATNPFLRSSSEAIKRAAEQFAGRPLTDAEAVFTTLRRWKDQF
jgi:hydroxyacylglutathione hydrolase